MKLPGILFWSLLAASPLAASAEGGEGPAAPLPYVMDKDLHVSITTYGDRRTVLHSNGQGGLVDIVDPLFNGDAGREGKILSIRLATEAEIENFPRLEADHYAVLTYSSGNVLVVQVVGTKAVRPEHCSKTGPYIVSRNIACKMDMAKAKVKFLDALNREFLSPGPSMVGYKPTDFSVPGSDIVVHVKADGRTVWASTTSGKRLWKEDPFKAAGMEPYRFYRPVIRFVGPVQDWTGKACHATGEFFVGLGYNSSQFGCLNARTGRFVFLGQD